MHSLTYAPPHFRMLSDAGCMLVAWRGRKKPMHLFFTTMTDNAVSWATQVLSHRFTESSADSRTLTHSPMHRCTDGPRRLEGQTVPLGGTGWEGTSSMQLCTCALMHLDDRRTEGRTHVCTVIDVECSRSDLCGRSASSRTPAHSHRTAGTHP